MKDLSAINDMVKLQLSTVLKIFNSVGQLQ